MQPVFVAVSAGILLIASGMGFAQDAKTEGQRPIQEIRKLLTDVEENFSRGDAKGLAACWTPTGDFSGPAGEKVEGREAVERAFSEFFAVRKGRTLKLGVLSVRTAGENLALVDVLPEVKPPTAEDGGEAILSLVLVKRAAGWMIESARETASGRAPAQVQHLKDLEWMVGDWADEASAPGGSSVQSNCDWTANRSFLIRRFKVEGKAGVLRTGTEVIGWDPRARRIRSWVFDNNGGFGENLWVRDGNRWLVRYSGTQPDGTEVSATNILTVVDANTVQLESKDRVANGQRQPDGQEITIKRQAAAKETVKPAAKKIAEPVDQN
jgi:uncharacterized protein (TIGR02246 family)